MAKPALGRGLGALLGGASAAKQPEKPAANQELVQTVPVSRIHPCPFQPRKVFAEEALRELADSIRQNGIIQPLVVRWRGDDFELIAGERRWRASQLAGLMEVPIVIRQVDDRGVLELALIENLQRENLNPIEEAQGYSQLIEQFQLTQEEAAQRVGKSRAVVANALRLLKLPVAIQSFVREGKLSVGHAKVILGANDSNRQIQIADRVLNDGLNVRETEQLIQGNIPRPAKVESKPSSPTPEQRDPHIADLEQKIQERLASKVHLKYQNGQGAIEIRFYNDDDLDRILRVFGVSVD